MGKATRAARLRLVVAVVGAACVIAGCATVKANGTPAAPVAAPTATTVGEVPLFPEQMPADPANPFELYPRRPGAQGRDIERRVGEVAQIGVGQIRLTGAIRSTRSDAGAATPATPTIATRARDGNPSGSKARTPASDRAFAPVGIEDRSALVTVALRYEAFLIDDVQCSLTVVADGRRFDPFTSRQVPEATPTPAPEVTAPGVTSPEVTAPTTRLRVSFAVGPAAGPFDVACAISFFDVRVVWRIDA